MAENTKEKRSFEVGDKTYAVRRPKVEEIRKGNEIRSKAFNEALQRGDMLREQLESELRKRKLWSDSREEEYQSLRKKVLDGEFKLKAGGIKLARAKKIALEMADARTQMVTLLSSRTDLDSNKMILLQQQEHHTFTTYNQEVKMWTVSCLKTSSYKDSSLLMKIIDLLIKKEGLLTERADILMREVI